MIICFIDHNIGIWHSLDVLLVDYKEGRFSMCTFIESWRISFPLIIEIIFVLHLLMFNLLLVIKTFILVTVLVAIGKVAYAFEFWIRVRSFIWACFQEPIFQWAIFGRLRTWLDLLGNLSKPTWRWIGVSVWYWLASHPWWQERPCFHWHVILLITARVCSLRLYAAMPWSSVFNFSDYWTTESCPRLLCSTRKWSDLDTSQRRLKRSLVVKYGWIESRWEVCCSASREKFKMLP